MDTSEKHESISETCTPYSGHKHMYKLNMPNIRTVYKYMDMNTAIQCLKEGKFTLRFCEPTAWNDNYEKRFYKANYEQFIDKTKGDDEIPSIVYACCFTRNKTSEAAWKTYSYDKTGIASRCVKFKLNFSKLKKAIYNKIRKSAELYIGEINYMDDYLIDHLHEHRTTDNYFKHPFTRGSYLSLLLIKRQSFYYEKEVRFFIVPDEKKTFNSDVTIENDAIYIQIDIKDIIEYISIDDRCTDEEKTLFDHYITDILKFDPKKINKENLYKTPQENITIPPLP